MILLRSLRWCRARRLLALSPLLFALPARRVAAQERTVVEQLAPLLAAEDARDFRPDLFRRALVAPDSLVRRIALLAAGRIGDFRATPLMLPLLADADSTVRAAAAFAMGVLRDTAAVQPLIDRLTGLPALDGRPRPRPSPRWPRSAGAGAASSLARSSAARCRCRRRIGGPRATG